jgi:pyruvate/2-oxoglutarate dehydrogenase complex dihydrolipoamide dehydrogenase (E3) component
MNLGCHILGPAVLTLIQETVVAIRADTGSVATVR